MTSEPWLDEEDHRKIVERPRPLGEVLVEQEAPEALAATARGGPGALLRRWPTVLATLVVAWLCAEAFLIAHHPTYTSTTTVFLKPVTGNALSADSMTNSQQLTVAMETEARLVQSPGVAELAAKIGGSRLATQSAALSATVLPNTQIVTIQFAAVTPARALRGATAFATAFLDYRTAQAQDAEKRQLASLQAQSASAERQLQSAIREAAGPRPAPGASTRVQLYTSRLAAISENIGQIQSQDINPGSVVTPASTPRTTVFGSRKVALGSATVLGLVVAVLLALLRDRVDDRVRAEQDTEIEGVPVWARIPRRDPTPRFVDELDDDDPVRDGFRCVRTSIVRAVPRPCVVTLTRDPALPSVVGVALDIGLSLSGAGYRVVVVDASLEPDGLAGIASAVGAGLSDRLEGNTTPHAWTQQWRGLRLLTAGERLASARDLLADVRMAELVEELRSEVDFVVIAAPEATTAEAITLGEMSDATVLVAADRITRRRWIAENLARHAGLGASPIGIIAVHGSRRRRPRRRPWIPIPRIPAPRLSGRRIPTPRMPWRR
jgi:capsular polysaccharide biosynthesis protein